jgi:hypothetical protein
MYYLKDSHSLTTKSYLKGCALWRYSGAVIGTRVQQSLSISLASHVFHRSIWRILTATRSAIMSVSHVKLTRQLVSVASWTGPTGANREGTCPGRRDKLSSKDIITQKPYGFNDKLATKKSNAKKYKNDKL